MMNPCICMTATIEPNTAGVLRSDVQTRLNDYKTCIRFYLDKTKLPIFFLENSGYNLDNDPDFLKFCDDSRFSILRYAPHNDFARGKGFQEFYMLDQFVKKDLRNDGFIKVTGRYTVKNIQLIINKLSSPICIDLHRKMKVAITGLFYIEKDLYDQYFLGAFAEANDDEGRFIEHVLYSRIKQEVPLKYHSLLPETP